MTMMSDTLQQACALMRTLGERLGVVLPPDGDGAWGLRIGGRLTVTLECEEAAAALLVHAEVGELPLDDAEPALRRLLAHNHLWHDGDGATWSLQGDTIVLMRRWPLHGLDADVLLAGLELFVAAARAEQDHASVAAMPEAPAIPPGVEVA